MKVKWENRGAPKSPKKHRKNAEKGSKKVQKRSKTAEKRPKNDQKQGKKHPKFMKNAKIKPFLAQKKTIKKQRKQPKTALFSTNTKVLQIFYKR